MGASNSATSSGIKEGASASQDLELGAQPQPTCGTTKLAATTTKPAKRPLVETPAGRQSGSKKNKNEEMIDGLLIKTLGQINAEDDEDDLFGRQVSATLHKLSRHQKAIAKLQIQTVLLNVEFPGPAIENPQAYYHPYSSEM